MIGRCPIHVRPALLAKEGRVQLRCYDLDDEGRIFVLTVGDRAVARFSTIKAAMERFDREVENVGA